MSLVGQVSSTILNLKCIRSPFLPPLSSIMLFYLYLKHHNFHFIITFLLPTASMELNYQEFMVKIVLTNATQLPTHPPNLSWKWLSLTCFTPNTKFAHSTNTKAIVSQMAKKENKNCWSLCLEFFFFPSSKLEAIALGANYMHPQISSSVWLVREMKTMESSKATKENLIALSWTESPSPNMFVILEKHLSLFSFTICQTTSLKEIWKLCFIVQGG